MKTASILFFSTIAMMLIVPMAYASWINGDIQERGLESTYASQFIRKYVDTIQVGGPDVEKYISLGYTDGFYIENGMQLVHDATLGDQVKFVGPQAAVDNIELSQSEDRYFIKFKRAILLDEPVEIHVNVDEHNLGVFSLYARTNGENPAGESHFIAKSPVKSWKFELQKLKSSQQPILVDNNFFAFHPEYDEDNTFVIQGKTTIFNTRLKSAKQLDVTSFLAEEVRLYANAPTGLKNAFKAETISLNYNFENLGTTKMIEAMNLVPDTLVVQQNTDVKVYGHKDDNSSFPADSLVHIIRQ
ncbi:MAG: hypothetical protein AAF828_06110 [Bacteroidota bacterium]